MTRERARPLADVTEGVTRVSLRTGRARRDSEGMDARDATKKNGRGQRPAIRLAKKTVRPINAGTGQERPLILLLCTFKLLLSYPANANGSVKLLTVCHIFRIQRYRLFEVRFRFK